MISPDPARSLRTAFKTAVVYPAQAVAAFLFYGLFALLPIDTASALGGWLARTIGPRLGGVSNVARRNLRRAFPDKGDADIEVIVREVWDNLGRVVGEFPHLHELEPSPDPSARLHVVGLEHIDLLRDDGRPGIFFSAHLANWEVAALVANHRGLPLAQVYRAPDNPLVGWLFRGGRRAAGGEMIPKGSAGAKRILEILRDGGHLGMLVDQKMNDGIAVPFFGRDAMTAPALAQFGLKHEAPIVPARVERLEGARFRMTIYPPMEQPRTGNRQQDVADFMRRVNATIEDWVRARPGQWLWLHRRWPN